MATNAESRGFFIKTKSKRKETHYGNLSDMREEGCLSLPVPCLWRSPLQCNNAHEILQLEKEIQIYSDNLELIRSGKINSEIADFMKKLDKTVADQREIHKENLETAEREVFRPAETLRSEAEASLEEILRDYGAKQK